ncbi:hypothetical protein H2248_011887 [Termitomyces sp. 'cryptogamus']|nr:hypothetical protein H2248_011887 [Termitomyces sp. 'cryptogamus']
MAPASPDYELHETGMRPSVCVQRWHSTRTSVTDGEGRDRWRGSGKEQCWWLCVIGVVWVFGIGSRSQQGNLNADLESQSPPSPPSNDSGSSHPFIIGAGSTGSRIHVYKVNNPGALDVRPRATPRREIARCTNGYYLLGTLEGGNATETAFESKGGVEVLLDEGDHRSEVTFAEKIRVLYQHSFLVYGLMLTRRHVHQLVELFMALIGANGNKTEKMHAS